MLPSDKPIWYFANINNLKEGICHRDENVGKKQKGLTLKGKLKLKANVVKENKANHRPNDTASVTGTLRHVARGT